MRCRAVVIPTAVIYHRALQRVSVSLRIGLKTGTRNILTFAAEWFPGNESMGMYVREDQLGILQPCTGRTGRAVGGLQSKWRSECLSHPYLNSLLSFYTVCHSAPACCSHQAYLWHGTQPLQKERHSGPYTVFHKTLPCAALACKMNEVGALLQHLPKILCDNLIKFNCNYTSQERKLRLGRQAQICHFLSFSVFSIQ